MATSNLTLTRPSQTNPDTNVKLSDIKNDNDTARLNFRLPKQSVIKLKRYALENDKSMTDVIISLIDTLDQR